MKKTVIIGGGTVGLDITQVFARNSYDAVMYDIRDEIIQTSEARLNKGLDGLMNKGKPDEAKKAEILSHMSFITELAVAVDAGLVVEATIGNLDIEKSTSTELDSLYKPEIILASNMSSISITVITTVTKRVNKFIGVHFPNPTIVMELMEVIRGTRTPDETYRTIAELAAVISKEPVEVSETPGFVVNKILIPTINEGIDLAYTSVTSVEDVDTAMKPGVNHPIGLLALGGLVGLDVCPATMGTLYDETHDPKYRASLLLRGMVHVGKPGCKTGIGFCDHSKK